MSSNYRLLVFDWDGTLMDSEARIVACVRAAAHDLSIEAPDDGSIRNIIGLGLREAVTTLFPGTDDELIGQLVTRYRHHFLHVDKTPSELFPGAEQLLERLAQRQFLLAVATGKGRQGLDKALRETGLNRFFHATRCADETFSKPHPEMLQQIMDELGVAESDTLMIGDTEFDMQMANNARTHALAVGYGVHEPERLLRHAPLACLENISALGDWLESHG